jgi:hypothetical protein
MNLFGHLRTGVQPDDNIHVVIKPDDNNNEKENIIIQPDDNIHVVIKLDDNAKPLR